MALDYTRAIALGLMETDDLSVPHMINILNAEIGPYGFFLSAPRGQYKRGNLPDRPDAVFQAMTCRMARFSLRHNTSWVTKPDDLATKLREVLTIIGEMPKEG